MNFFKRIVLVPLLLVYVLVSNAQLNLNEPMPVDPKVKIGKLSNGLTYYIRQNKKPEQKVELRLVVNTGSIMEDDDQQGLAHMAEHMAFNGTKNFKKNDIVSFLQKIGVGFGADLNAYTSFDETVYILPIPTDKPDNLEKGFQVLEDWAHQVSYLDEDIEGERAIILEESRLGKGAQDRMFKKLYPKLFAGSKYANRLPIGIDSIIKGFKPDAIRRFYRDWYRPDLMAVMVVGDIDPAKAEEMVKKHFAGLTNPATERPRDFVKIPPYATTDAIIVTDKEATQNVMFLQNSPRLSTPSTTIGGYKKDIVKNIFVAVANQRLQELTQKENPPFVFAGVDFGEFVRGHESFGATVASGTGDPKKSLAAALEEVERIKRFGVTQSELDRAKKSVMANMESAFKEKDKTESGVYVEEYIRNFLSQEAMPGITKEFEYYNALIPAITLQEVNAVANDLQTDSHYMLALTGSEKSAASFPSASDLLATVTTVVNNKDIKAYEEKAIASSLLDKLPKPGKVVKETVNAALKTKTWTLSNGVEVTIKKTDFKNDEILLGARRAGGLGNYGLADKYNAQYASTVVATMGYGNFSPTDLQKVLAGKVASVTANMGPNSDNFSGSSSVKDAETMFQLLYLNATAPRLDTALYKSLAQRARAQMAFMMANPQTAFTDTLNKVLYDRNPMAPEVPRPEIFDKINVNRALAIFKERFGDMTGMHFAIVGNYDEKALKKLVETYVASLPASGKKFTWKDNGVRPVKGKVNLNFNKGEADKSQIVSIHTGELPYSEDMELKADAISEILNIRIIEELREKIQGIYGGGMSGTLRKIPYPSYTFRITLPTGPEKIDTLLYAMNAEIAAIKKDGPSKENLDKVKQQWLEQNKEAMKQNGTWLNEILEVKFPGTDVKRFLEYEKYVNALTPKQVQDAANVLLNGKNVVTAVLRPDAKANNANTSTTPTKAAPKLIGDRKVDVQKLLELPDAAFTVDVYDNGDIDGDIITLYYNGQQVLSKQPLTDKPVSIKLMIDDKKDKNELVMFADNLGSTPPNTALAIITSGGQRFEVRISSDTTQSGSIQLKVKK
ncbi:MAG: insulinase family protein [Bacteroidota bacterium]